MRCFFSCAIKKEASSISFGDASHAYVKLLYARERVEMQAGRRGKGSSTNVRNTGLNISLLSIISKNYKILLLQQQLLLLFESQSQIDVEFATDQKIDWDRCLHSIALLLHSIMRYSTTGKIWKTSSACTLGSSLCLYLQVSWAMDLDLTNHKSWVPR